MAKSQLPDAQLVDKYVAGDENALAILIDRHQSKIYGYIYSKVSDRDVTEDIFQETFFKVIHTLKVKKWQNWDRNNEPKEAVDQDHKCILKLQDEVIQPF